MIFVVSTLRSALLMAGIAAAGTQPAAPVALHIGDARIDSARLQPYKARWKETLVNGINQVIERGVWDDELTRETRDGRDVLVRNIVITQPDGSVRERYRFVADARTMEPIRSEWSGGGLSYDYEYAGKDVRGVRVNKPGGAPVKIATTLPLRAFDYYAGVMELFLVTLPRTPGAQFTFPAALATSGHTADQGGVHWPVAEVFPEETTRGAGGAAVRATRIETNTRYGFYKVWVTDAPPYVVRTVLLLAPGGRITYELL